MDELRSLMLDARITIINGVMTSFDRKLKMINIVDHNDKAMTLDYDMLVICVGLVDNTIKEAIKDKHAEAKAAEDIQNIKTMFSIDDPYIYDIMRSSSLGHYKYPANPIDMMTHKKRPQSIFIYGRSINTLSLISGLLRRGVNPEVITLVIPPLSYKQKDSFENNKERIDYEDNKLNDVDAFDGDTEVRQKVFEVLRGMNIKIMEEYHLVDVVPDVNDPKKIKTIKLKNDRNDRFEEANGNILVTSSALDIDEKLFDTIQENGLVYNGRLIVKNNFKTVDDCIFACGKVVEFSQQYKNYALGRSLRLDRYSGRELGQKLGQCVLEDLGIIAPLVETDPKYEKLPSFEMPVGVTAYLPNNLIYIRISSVQEGLPDKVVASIHQDQSQAEQAAARERQPIERQRPLPEVRFR